MIMSPSLRTLPRNVSADDVADCIDRDGGVIITNLIDDAVMDELIADLQPHFDRQAFGSGFTGNRTRRCNALLQHSDRTADLMLAPAFIGAAERLLVHDGVWSGANPDGTTTHKLRMRPTIQLSVTQAIELWPGQTAQEIHRDDSMYYARHPGPPTLVQALFAGTRYTAENGGTMVIPGSHRWDDERIPRLEEAIPIEMPRGSALVYVGGLYHAGGSNVTEDERRIAIAISYTLGYMRQEENQYLAVSPERARQLPLRVRELMGYRLCSPFCGWVDMRDPMEWLEAYSCSANDDQVHR
ncbi:phytanoyl-CoA dioxygenase family protein [Massilia sp. CT11-137]|uniref:phytanoyl-CoA dioxygenase family protein n=1 Tax=Massilia sp. CT11-137 TaxID=3393901 RepID=UPI0039AF60BD